MARSKNIIYLYSEVMPGGLAIMRALVKEFGVQLDCVCWDEKKRTPFFPENEQGLTFYKRSGFDKASLIRFIEERNPLLIFVTGRMDHMYLETLLRFRNKYPIVGGSDNQWHGTLKQWVAVVFSYFLYRRYFDYFWVPGPRQFDFASRIGYPKSKILLNHLSADTPLYTEAYKEGRVVKTSRFPHKMVFVGRYAKVKGIDILIQAFTEAKKEVDNDWTLTLVSTGDMPSWPEPFIDVKGFMSTQELAANCKDWGILCVPSTHEPWGVIIHEFAYAGLPIICSDAVGSADTLVIGNYNGYIFKSGDKDQLKHTILKVMAKSDNELLLMAERGHELSKMQSPTIAAYTLMSVVKD